VDTERKGGRKGRRGVYLEALPIAMQDHPQIGVREGGREGGKEGRRKGAYLEALPIGMQDHA
jgi:hypothetical protein